MKKYLLASKLYKKYRNIAHINYEKNGCNDKVFKTAMKISNFCSRILYKNGWDNCI